MGYEFDGCFGLEEPPRDLSALERFFGTLDIQFNHATARFVYDDEDPEYVFEREAKSANWEEFVADAQGRFAALNGTFQAGDCQFTLGFLVDSVSQRHCALFEITERNLTRLGHHLKEDGKDVLTFFAGIYRSLNAASFGLAIADYPTLMKFVRGERLDTTHEEAMRTSIAAPTENLQRFIASPDVKAFSIDGLVVHSRWLPGLDVYFGISG